MITTVTRNTPKHYEVLQSLTLERHSNTIRNARILCLRCRHPQVYKPLETPAPPPAPSSLPAPGSLEPKAKPPSLYPQGRPVQGGADRPAETAEQRMRAEAIRKALQQAKTPEALRAAIQEAEAAGHAFEAEVGRQRLTALEASSRRAACCVRAILLLDQVMVAKDDM